MSAALAVTVSYLHTYTCKHIIYFPGSRAANTLSDTSPVTESCSQDSDNINCCDKLTWLLFSIAAEGAVGICALFWATEYHQNNADSGISLHLHLVNALVALLDLWVSGVPVHLLHIIYVEISASFYVFFTVIYYAFGGTDLDGERTIYPILNYDSRPGLAVVVAIVSAVVGGAVIHIIFFLICTCRQWLTSHLLLRYQNQYQLIFSTSAAPDPSSQSSAPSSLLSDTTPIWGSASCKQHYTASSQESSL